MDSPFMLTLHDVPEDCFGWSEFSLYYIFNIHCKYVSIYRAEQVVLEFSI